MLIIYIYPDLQLGKAYIPVPFANSLKLMYIELADRYNFQIGM
jgi:hypothetical protein